MDLSWPLQCCVVNLNDRVQQVPQEAKNQERSQRGTKSEKSRRKAESDSEANLLVLQSQLHIIQRTKTELEAELTMTRTLCHELQAQSIERNNKLMELEKVILKAFEDMEKDHSLKDASSSGSKHDIDGKADTDDVDNSDSELQVDQILNQVLCKGSESEEEEDAWKRRRANGKTLVVACPVSTPNRNDVSRSCMKSKSKSTHLPPTL